MIPLLAMLLAAPPVIHQQIEYYDVSGDDATQLRAALDREGPMGSEGRRYDGRTVWNLTWTYRYGTDESGRCALRSYQITDDVHMILPQWRAPSSAPDELRRRWAIYVRALHSHEDGHVRNGSDAADAIVNLLTNFGSRPSCGDIDRELQARGKRIVQQFIDKDIDYDRDTRHGATQGAVFP
jgi:predicted secreted Zn-dependent protease